MLQKITSLTIILLLLGFGVMQAQDRPISKHYPVITGNENPDLSLNPKIEVTTSPVFGPVYAGALQFDVTNIDPSTFTGYDFQTNTSPHEVWYDLNNPGYLHAIFTSSQQTTTWSDRTCLYYGSPDGGLTWTQLGQVPTYVSATDGRAGFPVISVNSGGAAVISNHNNSSTTPSGTQTISKLYIDSEPFGYSFSEYDPLAVPGDANEPIWPRLVVTPDDDVVLVSTQSTTGGVADSLYINVFDSGTNSFLGWQVFDGGQGEGYGIGISESGNTIGVIYEGQATTNSEYDLFYIESTDGGMTWSPRVTVWECDPTNPDSMVGHWRGIDINFLGEEPCAVFEIGVLATGEAYYPQLPSRVMFWSPNINGGVPVTVADDSNVPFYPNGFEPNFGNADAHLPLGKPVIGRSTVDGYLFVAFVATMGEYWPGTTNLDSTAYMAGFFTYSSDGGATWQTPEKFTPDNVSGSPLMDWRYISIAPVNPVHAVGSDDFVTIHMVMQGDTIPASNTNAGGTGMPVAVSAQNYYTTTEIFVGPNAVGDPSIVNEFNLEQNYPNPFNPSTKINYTLAERTNVTLRVYDVLGKEVATLVNASQEAGQHNVIFDASNLASGLYIYKLQAGDFTSSRKMMLLK